jgi:hypothetical protein
MIGDEGVVVQQIAEVMSTFRVHRSEEEVGRNRQERARPYSYFGSGTKWTLLVFVMSK